MQRFRSDSNFAQKTNFAVIVDQTIDKRISAIALNVQR